MIVSLSDLSNHFLCLKMVNFCFFIAEIQRKSKGFLSKKGTVAVFVVGAAVMMVLLVSSFLLLRKKLKGNHVN